jgi:glycosyltransferase involved in cell wall biosynthesis
MNGYSPNGSLAATDAYSWSRRRLAQGVAADPYPRARDKYSCLMSEMNRPDQIRVLFLGKDASRGGGQRIQEYLLRFMDPQRFQSKILLSNAGPLLANYRRYAETHVYVEPEGDRLARWWRHLLGHRRGPESVRVWLRHRADGRAAQRRSVWVEQIVRQFQPHLVVRNYLYPNRLYDVIDSLGVPSVQHVFQCGSQIAWRSDDELRQVVARTRQFICEGRGARDYVVRCWGVQPDAISTVCVGIDLARRDEEMNAPGRVTRADLGIPPDALVIGTAGSILFLKGVDLWVEAAAILRARYPERPLKFIWVGGAEWQFNTLYGSSVRRLAHTLGLSDDLLFVGDQSSVYPYLDLCDIYVQPSRDDAYPHATLEAMALGKPVVASPQGVALEDYAHDALIHVEAASAQRLADGVSRLIQDPVERARLGQASLSLVRERFAVEDSVRRYEEILLQVVEKSGHGG